MTTSTLCTKRSFHSKREAKAMLHSTMESPSSARKECRSYKCDKCRTYHLTSMSLEDFEAEQEKATSKELSL